MAWTTPSTAVAGSTALTAAFWNEQVRDNTQYLKDEADAVGSELITTATGSTISVNNCFTSAHQYYKIFYTMTAALATSAALSMRLRVSGSDDTANDYIQQLLIADGAVITGTRATATSFGNVGEFSNQAAQNSSLEITVFDPAISRSTVVHSFSSGALIRARIMTGIFQAGTVFDGFTIFPSSGTVSGTLRVYGLR